VIRRGGPDRTRFEVTQFVSGSTTHYLAILRSQAASLSPRTACWGLTRRENQVVLAILRGATNRQIANELGCAMKTIEHHVSSILRKANLENRASLIVAILEP
jgi:DNA-binding NarL/FixJ family response regulator